MREKAKEFALASWRAVRAMVRERYTGTAAELAYYGLLSAVPAIAALVGIVGLVGQHPETTDAITKVLAEDASIEVTETVRSAAESAVEHKGASGIAVGTGLLTTLWAASLYLGAFRRAAYRVHGVDPGAAWKVRPLQLLFTFLGLAALAIALLAIAATERIAERFGDAIGLEEAVVELWSLARWPLVLLLVVAITAALFNLAPREDGRRVRLLSVGSVAAVVVWVLVTIGFDVYVSTFASYDATYGALGGFVAFAIWLWVSNLALLFGLMLDLERQAGAPSRA